MMSERSESFKKTLEKEVWQRPVIVAFPLRHFSLQAQKLTLRDVILESTLSNKDALEEFFPCHSSASLSSKHSSNQVTIIVDPQTPRTKINLDYDKLCFKQNEIKTLMQLYDSEMVKLSCGSHLWFGNVNGHKLSLFIDFSDEVCHNDNYEQYLDALKLLFAEQLQVCEKTTINVFGMNVTTLDADMTKSKMIFEKKLNDIESQGSCNLLNCFETVFDTSCDIDAILIILCSRPDQDLDVLYDYIVQILSGRNQDIKIHIAAINASEDVQVFLKSIVDLCKGHYHYFNSRGSETFMEDTLFEKLYEENKIAEKCISDIENIQIGNLNQSLIDTLKELSLVAVLHIESDSSPFSCYSIPCSTEVWLNSYGLDSLGLNLYDVLEQDVYTDLSEYVPLIDKTALSIVYDNVMPKCTWKDGSQKYLNVNVHKLESYMDDLRVYSHLLEKRLIWLKSESRVVFGNIPNDRVIIIIDSSLKTSLHHIELKQHLKTLLNEQIIHKQSFNIISYSRNGVIEWRKALCSSDKEALSDAWRWILDDVKPVGSFNLLACLRNSINQCLADFDNDEALPLDICLLLSSIPDQDADYVKGFIEQELIGSKIQLHIVLYQPCIHVVDADVETLLLHGIGRYGEGMDVICYAETLSEIGTLHQFRNGEFNGSNDHSELINEISRTMEYYEIAREILDDYEVWCKRNVAVNNVDTCHNSKHSEMKVCHPPVYPRQTLSSIARMNHNMIKAQMLNQSSFKHTDNKEKKCFLTCHTFYTGHGIRKGLFYDLVESTGFTTNKSLIPSNESYLSSAEWLQLYSLKSLGLYTDKLFKYSKKGCRHITADGRVIQLKMNHQQLCNLMTQIKKVRMRYFSRLQWLLSDSRLVFGCIRENKIVLMVDISASMSVHFLKLTDQISDLINEQFIPRKCLFNVVVYAQNAKVWKPDMYHCTEKYICELVPWLKSLSTGGSSCLLEGIDVSLSLQPDAIYIVTDGESDHSCDYVLSHIKQFYPDNCRIHTISYHSRNSARKEFLKEVAHTTIGRYHSFPTEYTEVSSHNELGDDLNLIVKEIEFVDSIVSKLLYYTGRIE